MNLDHVKVKAEEYFYEATCPKGHGDMVQLDNGWFSTCWYCEKCGYPYELVMTKMRKVNQEGLAKALAEKGIKPNQPQEGYRE